MHVLGFFVGHWEWLLIGGVIVVVFFARRIPEAMRSLGKGVSQFKKGLKEGKEEAAGGDVTGKGAAGKVEGAREVKALPVPEQDGADARAGVGAGVKKEKQKEPAGGSSEDSSA